MKCNEYDVDNKDALGLGIDFINRGRNFNIEINMLNSPSGFRCTKMA